MFGIEIVMIMFLGMIVNIIIVCIMKFKYIFLIGYYIMFMVCLIVVILFIGGLMGVFLVLIGVLLLGILMVLFFVLF